MQNFFYDVDIKSNEVSKGIKRKILSYNKDLMVCKLDYLKGGVGELHKHFHSQSSYIISGVFEFEVDGVKKILKAGDSLYVQPEAMHGCLCIEKGTLLDIFTPQREDFLHELTD
jgi:quercetin dioxygenase-like cupin family protein